MIKFSLSQWVCRVSYLLYELPTCVDRSTSKLSSTTLPLLLADIDFDLRRLDRRLESTDISQVVESGDEFLLSCVKDDWLLI